MKLRMEIVSDSEHIENEIPTCYGRIYIGDDFWETALIALNYWTIEDYERQWKEGLERLKTHETSCLVASVQHPEKTPPLINWWPLYKQDNKLLIHNELIVGEDYAKTIGSKDFTVSSCYQFIQPLTPELYDLSGLNDDPDDIKVYQVSEWIIDL